jgi:hypothetical protein
MHRNKLTDRTNALAQQERQMPLGLSLLKGLTITAACAMALSAWSVKAQTANVAEVEYVRGIALAQQANAAPRIMGKGSVLAEGDRISTSDGSLAIVKLQDGTRMTVRPSTELVLTQFKYDAKNTDNSMVLNLLRGGLRAITGLINKNGAGTARIQTNTATIGIRGTDFDARLCRSDCIAEGARISDTARPNAVQASAKLQAVRGQLDAVSASGERRRVTEGAPLYPGETVETSPNSEGVLIFRDESKVRLGQSSRLRIDEFVYTPSSTIDSRYVVSLLRGSLRAVTGLIGKAAPRNVTYRTNTATIGIRGTELGIECTGACAGESIVDPNTGTRVFTYAGQVAVQWSPVGGVTLPELLLSLNQGAFLPSGSVNVVPLTEPPSGQPGTPDNVPVTPGLFSFRQHNEQQEGLYVTVRDGHVEIIAGQEILQLGRGETGYSGLDTQTYRPINVPLFIDFDQIPLPTARNPQIVALLQAVGLRQNNAPICR